MARMLKLTPELSRPHFLIQVTTNLSQKKNSCHALVLARLLLYLSAQFIILKVVCQS